MNKLCDDEIDRLTANINELNKKWSSHSKQNHYNKPHLFEKNNADILNCGPKEQSNNTKIINTSTNINTNTNGTRDDEVKVSKRSSGVMENPQR
jgi:hypothetical protein